MHRLVDGSAPRLKDIRRDKDISAAAKVSHFKIGNKWAAIKYTHFLKKVLCHHWKQCHLPAFFYSAFIFLQSIMMLN